MLLSLPRASSPSAPTCCSWFYILQGFDALPTESEAIAQLRAAVELAPNGGHARAQPAMPGPAHARTHGRALARGEPTATRATALPPVGGAPPACRRRRPMSERGGAVALGPRPPRRSAGASPHPPLLPSSRRASPRRKQRSKSDKKTKLVDSSLTQANHDRIYG